MAHKNGAWVKAAYAALEIFKRRSERLARTMYSLPHQWWGTYQDAHGPGGVRVRRTRDCWVLSKRGKVISRHDSRVVAIRKGRAS